MFTTIVTFVKCPSSAEMPCLRKAWAGDGWWWRHRCKRRIEAISDNSCGFVESSSSPPSSTYGKAPNFCVEERNDRKKENESMIRIRGRTVFLPWARVLWKKLYKLVRNSAEHGRDGHAGKEVYHSKFQSWPMIKYSYLLHLHTFPIWIVFT